MRRTARLLSTVPLAAAIGLTSAAVFATGAHAAPAPAKTATASGWRIVASYPAGSSVEAAAAGPNSAWVVEDCQKPCSSADGWILRHWNGKTWSVQPQSAAEVKHVGDDAPLIATAPGSRDLWAVYGEYDKTGRVSAVEWTGKSWAKPTLFPKKTNLSGFVAAGPASVWVTGTFDFDGAYAYRYNGQAWVKAPLPAGGVNGWTFAAGHDGAVWAQSFSSKSTSLAESRWNGKQWVAQQLPAAPKGQVSASNDPGGLVTSGPSRVWGNGYFAFAQGSGNTQSSVSWLVHFNGKTWSNVKVPYKLSGSIMAGPLGSDGHGGAWFEAVPFGTTKAYLYHVSAAGHWTRDAIPALKGTRGTEISGFAPVPGTSSTYAYGFSAGPGTPRGVLLEYQA